ncbi:acyltransferase [uncultured Dokdonia sp.]|uniref:acyltransferase n=1 Tax=uncultured Dokdonia sp. TaxID=575653 RepID=UPI0026081EBB|nr:acyltransferase [uncultured Dokdonia sp.]
MKSILIRILRFLAQIFYYKIDLFDTNIHPLVAFRMGIIQRIVGINRSVRFPVHFTSQIINPKNIILGKRTAFPGYSIGCYIQANSGIIIGDDTRIGPGVKIISENHDLNDNRKHIKSNPIKIGDNCWLGANSVILPGVQIENHTIVGAGCVVTKSFTESNIVLGGIPAKIIKRF